MTAGAEPRGRARRRGLAGLALVALLACAGARHGAADVISTTGSLVLGVSSGNVCNLTAAGLGIGVTSPSANLHVAGNAVVSGRLGLGTTAPVNSLEVSGSLGFSVQSVSSNTVLSGNSMVLVDTSGGNVSINMPDADSCPGRVYHIKKSSSLYSLTVNGLVDGSAGLVLTSSANGLPYVDLVSGANVWWIVGCSSDATTGGGVISPTHLVSWWTFDGTVNDSSSQANHGTVSGAPFYLPGRYGKGIKFDGVDDYVKASGSVLGTTYSISLWFNPHATGGSLMETAALNNTKDNFPNFLLQENGANLRSYDNGSGYSSTLVALSTYTWYHVVATRTPTNETCYVNGANVLSRTIDNTSGNKAQINLGVGYNAFANALVDDVRIYDKVLSGAEVQAIYGASSSNDPLVGYWSLDSTVTDASVYGNHGTINGAPGYVAGQFGNALDFDGVDDYVSISGNVFLTTTWSISLWFKVDTLRANQGIMESASSGATKEANPNILLQANNASLMSYAPPTGYSSTLETISTGTWYHFVSVRTATNETCYVNGVQKTSWAITNTSGNKAQLNLGVGYNSFFDGQIDNVRFYWKALSAAEVSALYSAP